MTEVLKLTWRIISRVKTGHRSLGGESSHFKKCITLVDLTAFGLASVVGTGIHIIISYAACEHAGPSVVLSVLVASVTTLLSALCHGELVEMYPGGSSCYTFVYLTIGEMWAFLVGWNMILELVVGSAVAAKAFVHYADAVVNGTLRALLEPKMTAWASTQPEYDMDVIALILVLFITILISLYVKALCVVNNFLVLFGLLVVGGAIVVELLNMDSENWMKGAGFFPKGLSGILSASSSITFAFVGFDMMAAMAKETSSYHSTLLSSVNTYVFSIGLLFLFTASVALTSMVPYASLAGTTSMVDVFQGRLAGMKIFAAVGAASCLFSSAIAAHFSAARILQVMASDGLLFSPLARVHPVRGTPWRSAVLSGTMASILATFFDIGLLVRFLGIGTLLNSAAAPVAVLVTYYGVGTNDGSPPATSVFYDEDFPPPKGNDDTSEIRNGPTRSSSREVGETSELLRLHMHPSEHSGPFVHPSQGQQEPGPPPAIVDPRRAPCNPAASGNVSKMDYGSIAGRETSVEFVGEGVHTTLLEHSPFEVPTSKSWSIFLMSLLTLTGVVSLLGVYGMYCWHRDYFYWHVVVVCFSICCIVAVIWILVQQPRHHFYVLHNPTPCVPFLPLFTLSLHLLLMICLPSAAWIRLAVWSFMGLVVYGLYGTRHSHGTATGEGAHSSMTSSVQETRMDWAQRFPLNSEGCYTDLVEST